MRAFSAWGRYAPGIATRFINIDRNTPLLLPPDLRDWVPEDDIVHFVIEAVEGMRLATLKVHRRGSGSEQYPPKMMLALLIAMASASEVRYLLGLAQRLGYLAASESNKLESRYDELIRGLQKLISTLEGTSAA